MTDSTKKSNEVVALFEGVKAKHANKPSAEVVSNKPLPKKPPKQLDFFVLDLADVVLKSDQISMEVPIFSLSKKPDFSVWNWTSSDGKKSVEISPNVKYGRATQFDKGVWIFCISQLVAAQNEKKEISRTVRFTASDFIAATNKSTGGNGYISIEEALIRLKGTTIITNVVGTEKRGRNSRGSGLIDDYQVKERPSNGKDTMYEVTLPEWLFEAVLKKEKRLTLHPDYFLLRKPLERRLYEIARKHVGRQGTWSIGLAALKEKTGSAQKELRVFKATLKEIIAADNLPEYRIVLGDRDMVMFYSRDAKALAGLMKK